MDLKPFHFLAIRKNSSREKVTGVVCAYTKEEAKAKISTQGLDFIWVHRQYHFGSTHVTSDQLAELCRHWRYFLPSISHYEILSILSEHFIKTPLEIPLSTICTSIEHGHTLHQSFGEFPGLFDSVFLTLLEIGQKTASIPHILERLEIRYTTKSHIEKTVRAHLFYPVLVLIIMSIACGVFLMHVMPILNQNDVTAHVNEITGGQFYTDFFMWFSVLCVIGFLGVIILCPTYKDRIILKIPGIGALHHLKIVGGFLENLGLLLMYQVPIMEAFETSLSSIQNRQVQEDLRGSFNYFQSGTSLCGALQSAIKRFPLVNRFMQIAEKQGNFGLLIHQSAQLSLSTVLLKQKKMIRFIEPSLMILMGLLLLWLIMHTVLPLYDELIVFDG